jgi:16S rRNA A1518/A1519 N6-dimethyltransferase RsmA/KsgA/DIM1 with predicted DNA glycosylase/AP lyase activity
MGAEVTKRVQGTPLAKKLEVILGDVIKMPEMPPCDALISNTPYQISSPLIFKMLSMPNPPRIAVLMVRATELEYITPADDGVVSTRVRQETGCQAR